MKINKLFILVVSMPMLLAGATSCGVKHTMKHEEFKKDPQGLTYLYEVTYDDYSWDDVTDWMENGKNNENAGAFGCSSVHNGNFYGRSFDFCFTDMCEFLVRTPKTKDRYASIGMSIADCHVNEEKVNKIIDGTGGEQEKLNEKMIPFTMVDGINENGVVCNTNVVPAKDLPAHEGEEQYHTHGTNPGKPDLFYQFMPRFILDNATSAKQAVELLKNRNITAINSKGEYRDYLGVSKMGYELHCMIADKNDTYIIELVEDRMSIIAGDIMTNFYYSNVSPSGAGFERHHTLWDYYDEGFTLEGMENLIQRVQYSPCYDPEWNTDEEARTTTTCPMWPTEFAGCGVTIIPKEEKYEGLDYKLTFYNAEYFCTVFWDKKGEGQDKTIKEGIDAAYKTIRNFERAPGTGGGVPWISTHAEVFDIDNRTLHLVTQEQTGEGEFFDGTYDFKPFKL